MNPRPDFCPGCGAQVYPEESHCPFCGRGLRSSPWLSFLMGLGGAAAALLVGALIWWVLDALPSSSGTSPAATQQQAAVQDQAPADPAQQPAAPAASTNATPDTTSAAAAAPSPALAQPSGLVAPPASSAGVQAFAPTPAAPGAAPAASSAGTPAAGAKDAQRFASTTAGSVPTPGAEPAANPVSEEQLPLPTVTGPTPEVAADAEARREFAKSTQERFTQNGLDLTVGTSGEGESVLTIKFNFPAKTAAELIVAGPFPHQCAQRGFRQVVFADPSGVSWLYDVASQKMTQK